jgi:hypothetical protein
MRRRGMAHKNTMLVPLLIIVPQLGSTPGTAGWKRKEDAVTLQSISLVAGKESAVELAINQMH